MALRLAAAVQDLPGLKVVRPVQANAVFAVLDPQVTARLQQRFHFYVWDEHSGEVRWMTTFDTTEADIDAFAAAIREELTVPERARTVAAS
jgi:threonine aldolase